MGGATGGGEQREEAYSTKQLHFFCVTYGFEKGLEALVATGLDALWVLPSRRPLLGLSCPPHIPEPPPAMEQGSLHKPGAELPDFTFPRQFQDSE